VHFLPSNRQVQSVKKGTLTLAPLKTRNSRRALALPMLVVDALKARRVVQLEERMRAGAAWSNPDDHAFTTPQSAPVHPSKVRVILNGLLEAAGLARVKFHTLRHSAATMLLVDGTPLFDVSRVLGHAQVSTTADIYGHLVPEMAAGAAARMDTLLKTASKA
jgi:integrase